MNCGEEGLNSELQLMASINTQLKGGWITSWMNWLTRG